MIAVVDANVLISALLGSRRTIMLLTKSDMLFYAPKFILAEIRKYKTTISTKAKITAAEFDAALEAVLKFVTLMGELEYKEHLPRARKALHARDVNDAPYLACALLVDAEIIWTNDKDFSAQTIIKTRTTQQLRESK